MRPHLVAVAVASLAGPLAAPGLWAYPIAPRTLWQQVEEAELVVLARVANVEPREVSADDPEASWNTHTATLEPIEVWKGEVEAEGPLLVRFPGNLVCPAPPMYRAGERVVAFLSRDGGGVLDTVGLSYGTLYPDAEMLRDVREMAQRAARLQARPLVAPGDRLAWTVEAAARPGTRWHGLYELHPRGDELHSFYDRGTERTLARTRLSAAHLGLLASSFVAYPTTDQTAVMMLGLLAGWRSPALDRTAAGVVEAVLRLDTPPWWTRDLVAVTLRRFGDRDVEERLASVVESCGKRATPTLGDLWQQARVELGIPEVPPVPIREPEARGVGGRTPS